MWRVVKGRTMTEAMSRREIEDVLTSIKRLVSQDVSARVVPAPLAEKLVLTPSLRVPEENVATEELRSVEETDDRQPPEPETLTDARIASDLPSQWPADPASSVVGANETRAPGLTERAAQVGASGSLIQRISQARKSQDSEGAATPDRQDQPDRADTDAPSDILVQTVEDAALEETLARLEAVLSGKTPPKSSDAAQPVDGSAPAISQQGAVSEQIIDEGMLYQLVAHIVRQELQGELGEKITRNIRKLVRAEVARELQLRRP